MRESRPAKSVFHNQLLSNKLETLKIPSGMVKACRGQTRSVRVHDRRDRRRLTAPRGGETIPA